MSMKWKCVSYNLSVEYEDMVISVLLAQAKPIRNSVDHGSQMNVSCDVCYIIKDN